MDVCHGLAALFTPGSTAINETGQGTSPSSLPHLGPGQCSDLFSGALKQVEAEELMDKGIGGILFNCYFPGRLLVAESERANGSLPILRKVAPGMRSRKTPPDRPADAAEAGTRAMLRWAARNEMGGQRTPHQTTARPATTFTQFYALPDSNRPAHMPKCN
ncbi:hypothetical protein PAPHI01_2386 [Pancytospora philotis]|nr:hypothetical protein PAPHI01_2386 [Pancytospora philotis]